MSPVAQKVEITAPNFETAQFHIIGRAPLVTCKFSQKAREQMHETQAGGEVVKNKGKKKPKDFQADYEAGKHISEEGWCGIPAIAFRAAMVRACKTVGYVMTDAKLAISVIADGFTLKDGTALVKITRGEPHYFEAPVRLANGSADLRARPMWDPGWEAIVTVEFDADMMSLKDVSNLMMRVGRQVGIGEGRNDSKKSCGQGWGFFDLKAELPEKKKAKGKVAS